MPYELCQFQDGDVSLAYEVYGRGERTLIYLHGLLLDSHVNRRLARDLAAEGNRVILLDLPGHGASDKPRRASAHRMDAYAQRVFHLMDGLGIDKAVVGGVSLGANVTLQMAMIDPSRLQGMLIEMPVLEQATPVAALIFVPLLTAAHYAAPVMRFVTRLAKRLPRERLGPFDQVLGPLLLDPEEMVSVLHGILVGPVAPTAEDRQHMTVPSLVIGHASDRLHPLGDAAKLAKQLPNGRLLEARSIMELRVRPERLTIEIADFLDEVWSDKARQRRATLPQPLAR
jgi:pimeloyl-ACP methyl ester carboxylesterase